MDLVEQRIVLKFLSLKGLRYKAAHAERSLVLGEEVYSLSQTKPGIRRFKDGHLLCENEDQSEIPLSELTDRIRRQLDKFPFTSVKTLAKQFSTSLPTIIRILKTNPGLKKFSKRWVPHDLTDDQKRIRCTISAGLLDVLRNDESSGFSHVATGGESWFSYHYKSTHCYAKSREEVATKTKATLVTKKAIVTIFFTGTKLLILGILPRERKFNQGYFLAFVAPRLSKENTRARRRVDMKQLFGHIDNSKCHDVGRIQQCCAQKN
jgi:hypothetical protein